MEGIDKVQGKRKKTRPPRGAARRSICPHPHSHPFEVRRKAVQLCLEESFPVERVAREMGGGSRGCLHGQVACKVFHDAKPALRVYTLRKRKETFDWINELTTTLMQVWAVHTQSQAQTARRLAVETWLQRNGVITVTQNKKVLPVFRE